MSTFDKVRRELAKMIQTAEHDLAEHQAKVDRLRTADQVLAEYEPGAVAFRKALKAVRRAPLAPSKPDRRAAIAAVATRAKVASPAPAGRPCGCAGRSGRHKRTCSKVSAAKPAKEPAPVTAAVVMPIKASPPMTGKRGAPLKGKIRSQRLHRCNVPIVETIGALQRQRPCGETVWDGDRAKHLRKEHDIAIGGAECFVELKDEEEFDADAA